MNYLNKEIVVIGLGYVGLPLVVRLSSNFDVIGYDISQKRVRELLSYVDKNMEFTKEDLKKISRLKFTSNEKDIRGKLIYIVAVPTPVDKENIPDLAYLKNACEIVGRNLIEGAIIIFESTVYPGVTEDFCAPIISKKSGLKYNEDFYNLDIHY